MSESAGCVWTRRLPPYGVRSDHRSLRLGDHTVERLP